MHFYKIMIACSDLRTTKSLQPISEKSTKVSVIRLNNLEPAKITNTQI